MKRIVTSVIVSALVMAAIAPAAFAAPTGNGEGHAYAYGLYKRTSVSAQQPAAPAVEPAPAQSPVVAVEWEFVNMYTDPAGVAPYTVPLYTATRSGSLGRVERFESSLADSYIVGGQVVYRTYTPVFVNDAGVGTAAGWSNPDHRLTYAYPGFTTVAWNGMSYPLESAQAAVAMATPGIEWECTYREIYDPAGRLQPGSFNAWAVLSYQPTTF